MIGSTGEGDPGVGDVVAMSFPSGYVTCFSTAATFYFVLNAFNYVLYTKMPQMHQRTVRLLREWSQTCTGLAAVAFVPWAGPPDTNCILHMVTMSNIMYILSTYAIVSTVHRYLFLDHRTVSWRGLLLFGVVGHVFASVLSFPYAADGDGVCILKEEAHRCIVFIGLLCIQYLVYASSPFEEMSAHAAVLAAGLLIGYICSMSGSGYDVAVVCQLFYIAAVYYATAIYDGYSSSGENCEYPGGELSDAEWWGYGIFRSRRSERLIAEQGEIIGRKSDKIKRLKSELEEMAKNRAAECESRRGLEMAMENTRDKFSQATKQLSDSTVHISELKDAISAKIKQIVELQAKNEVLEREIKEAKQMSSIANEEAIRLREKLVAINTQIDSLRQSTTSAPNG